MTDRAALPASVRAALHDEPVPDWRDPTLATLTDRRFSDQRWIFERKFDGMRCPSFRDGDRVRLLSRIRHVLNGTSPELVDALGAQHDDVKLLHAAMTRVLRTAVPHGRVAGRTSLWCPRCQPG